MIARSRSFAIAAVVVCAAALALLGYLLLARKGPGKGAARPPGRAAGEGLPIERVRVGGSVLSPQARPEWIAGRVKRNVTRVLLIGIDGADWDIIMPLVEKGALPNFRRLLQTGAHGYLKSLQPTLSPLIWTSIATGKLPEKHGILDFLVTDTAREKIIPTTSNFRKVKALWNILTDYGQSAGFIGWLATWPAEKVNGFIVSDRLCYHSFAYAGVPDDESGGLVYPESLMAIVAKHERRLEDVSYDKIRPFVNVSKGEYGRSIKGAYDRDNPVNNMRLILATFETYRGVGLDLLKRYRPRLFGIYFEAVDAASHVFMRYMPPRMEGVSEEDYEKYRGAIEEIYRRQDRALGEFLREADENTVVIIVSDHGFKTGKTRPRTPSEIDKGAAAAWHDLHGILLMAGKGVKNGEEIYGASVLDITPTILALMGFPVGRDMDGRVLREAFTDDCWRDNPVITVGSYDEGWKRERAEEPESPAMEKAIMDKLKTLGYINAAPKSRERDSGVVSGAARHRNLGIALIEKGDLEGAVAELRKALEMDPSERGIRNDLGIALCKLGRNREALEEFHAALAHDPDNASIVMNVGRALQYMGRVEESVGWFKKAIEKEPTMAVAHQNLGNAYLQTGRLDLAKVEYLKALEFEPNSTDASANLGYLREREGDEAGAEKAYNDALKSRPDFLPAHRNLALLYEKQGRVQEAIAHWEAAIRIDPSGEEAARQLKALKNLPLR